MRNIDSALIWNLLWNTPMLEVFDFVVSSETGLTVARGPTPSSSTISGADKNVVHYLVSRLELPNVTAGHTSGTPSPGFAGFQGKESTVALSFFNSSDQTIPPLEERREWPFATFPTLLSLLNVTAFRLSCSVWDQDCLVRLGAYLENVTELCLMRRVSGSESRRLDHFDATKAMQPGVALSRALLADDPVVFPELRWLDVDTVDTSWAFIAVLGPALEKRGRDGRRLRHLCINIGALWPSGRFRDRNVELNATGLFDHVDEGSSRRSDYSPRQDWDREVRHDMPRLPTHGYWQ
ncbi:hypothetical protein GSI_07914 [Ganoderma sinense ZZ0214-1]|uniref:Uncharacterized protein n=1 Tax=Ganoderma sinense ZZ0214-1 TaxID=1077348 RepID=A0A2G8S8A2_9APHY|nr:hypothetical protein GSI_07914 [Ganoderma sinense ZZ0214-1]